MLCFNFISFSRASHQLPFFCSVRNAPGSTTTLKDVTNSWARSRRSKDSIELTMLQNPKAVIKFTSVIPCQSAINSISFFLTYSIFHTIWLAQLVHSMSSSSDHSHARALPFHSWKLGRHPTSSNHLESSPRTAPWVVCHLASLFSEPINYGSQSPVAIHAI